MDDDEYILSRDTTAVEAHRELAALPESMPRMIPEEPGSSMELDTAAMTHPVHGTYTSEAAASDRQGMLGASS